LVSRASSESVAQAVWKEGQESLDGKEFWRQKERSNTHKTLKANCWGYIEKSAGKVMSGGVTRVVPGCWEKSPRK
jgi:hypothetical protein